MLFTALLFGESGFKKPESFKNYKKYNLNEMDVFIAPELINGLKIKNLKDTDELSDRKGMFFKINGQKVKLMIDPGPSEDYSFVFNYKGKKTSIAGEIIFISQTGTFYVSNRTNANYEIKRKFSISKDGIKEVKQAFFAVNLECKTSALAILYTKAGDKGTVVAKIPKGKTLKILVNTFKSYNILDLDPENKSFSNDYLVQTSFGLVGWVHSSAGYMRSPGKPLSCLMFEGD